MMELVKVGQKISGELVSSVYEATDEYAIYLVKTKDGVGDLLVYFNPESKDAQNILRPRYRQLKGMTGEFDDNFFKVQLIKDYKNFNQTSALMISAAINNEFDLVQKYIASYIYRLNNEYERFTKEYNDQISNRNLYVFTALTFFIFNLIISTTSYHERLCNDFIFIIVAGSAGGFISIYQDRDGLTLPKDIKKSTVIANSFTRIIVAMIASILVTLAYSTGFISVSLNKNEDVSIYFYCLMGIAAGFNETLVLSVLSKVGSKIATKKQDQI